MEAPEARGYAICAEPRSGSSFLCEELFEVNVLRNDRECAQRDAAVAEVGEVKAAVYKCYLGASTMMFAARNTVLPRIRMTRALRGETSAWQRAGRMKRRRGAQRRQPRRALLDSPGWDLAGGDRRANPADRGDGQIGVRIE